MPGAYLFVIYRGLVILETDLHLFLLNCHCSYWISSKPKHWLYFPPARLLWYQWLGQYGQHWVLSQHRAMVLWFLQGQCQPCVWAVPQRWRHLQGDGQREMGAPCLCSLHPECGLRGCRQAGSHHTLWDALLQVCAGFMVFDGKAKCANMASAQK